MSSTRYFEHIASKIGAAKRQAEALAAGLDHRGLEGRLRELAMRECIVPFLTQSFSVGTGKIIDASGKLSAETDLVVYHRKLVPPILLGQDLGLFPVECVKYAIEVKTRLTAAEIQDTNRKFATVASLDSYPGAKVGSKPLPVTVLLAFDSDLKGSEIDRYLKHTTVLPPPCTVLCVLGKGYWFFDAGQWHGNDTRERRDFAEFALFITGLMNTLASEETTIRPFMPGAYVETGLEIAVAVGRPPSPSATP